MANNTDATTFPADIVREAIRVQQTPLTPILPPSVLQEGTSEDILREDVMSYKD